MKKVNPLLANVPFGGKKFIIGGDFRQCLPVVLRGKRADIINASIKSSYLWNNIKSFSLSTNMRLSSEQNLEYSKLLMNIGNGTEKKTTINQFNDFITLPDSIWMPLNPNNLFNEIYEEFQINFSNPEYLNSRAILCPLNSQTDQINELATSLLPEAPTTYLSYDSIIDENNGNNLIFNIEYLNTLQISGLPSHKLDLKVHQPIILIRNLSNANGLCNGTRLMITSMMSIIM